MTDSPVADIREHFGTIEDPRVDRTKLHLLIDILVIAICAVVCGAEDWPDVEAFGKAKDAWLKKYLELPNGIPSHTCLHRQVQVTPSDEYLPAWTRGNSKPVF